MPIDMNTLLLWVIIGGCLWLVGRIGHNASKPKPETLKWIESNDTKFFVKIPNWAKALCGLSPSREHIQWEDVHLQLIGILAVVWGLIAGLLSVHSSVAPFLTLLGIAVCLIIPSLIVRYWQRH